MPITHVASSSSSAGSDTPAEPTGAASGDVLYAIATNESNTATFSPSVEWNPIRRDTGLWTDDFQINTYWCRRGGSAPSYDFGVSSSGLERVAVACLRGVKSSGDPHSVLSFNNANDTSPVASSITPPVANCFLLGLIGTVFTDALNHQPGAPHWESEHIDAGYVHILSGIAGTTSSGIYAPTSATGVINATSGFYWGATLIAVEPDGPADPSLRLAETTRRKLVRPAPFFPGIAR